MDPEPVKFYTDAHIAAAVCRALQRERIDITRAYEAGLANATDAEHLDHALREGRVLVTQDTDFLVFHGAGRTHAGIAFFHGDARIGYMISQLLLLHSVLTADEMRGRVEFL